MSTILACGAWLKNTACLLQDGQVTWSPLHGDLGDPANCIALDASVAQLVAQADGAIAAVAHDLHPDFFSTQLAVRVAAELGVPAIGVQHHVAHIGVVLATQQVSGPVIGVALDGVGLGTDGLAWGGELLLVDGAQWQRLGHLQLLALPGGDVAAREPWRMAAAALQALGRGADITPRFAAAVGKPAAQTVQTMLARDLRCPPTSSTGRWFDAAAGALGISVRQGAEAEAAIALEQLATAYLASHPAPDCRGGYLIDAAGVLDLRPVLARLFALADSGDIALGAALFHLTLVDGLTDWITAAAGTHHLSTVALGGGCFFNRLLVDRLTTALHQRGLRTLLPHVVSCGDAGLAFGQAWVVSQQLEEVPVCV
ncbi:(NiFe) hydrogenase metallocenter assembly protein HypF [Oxalobacteraceae bacterium IMCC9480]|nr:(NiFe) hydrogenase metallocenter assembly protein HypF [Oxalobacteraceae bacterium IMCC9480]